MQPSSVTVYDWTSIDTTFGLASQYNKTIGISVAAGVNTPPWVYDAGATKYALHDSSGLSMPPPWDTVFLAKWKAFIHAMGDRYDSNRKLGYVVISGLGQNVETYLSQSSVDDDLLTSMGGMPAWINAAKEIFAAYADAFPTTPFLHHRGQAPPEPSRPLRSAASDRLGSRHLSWPIRHHERVAELPV